MDPDEVLSRCLTLNVNALELRSQPVEAFLGSPGSNGRKATPDEMTKWRTSVQVDRAAAFRKKYESAGVLIEIVKYDGIYAMADAEVDYCFNLAKTLGRPRDLVRDRRRAHRAHRPVRRQAQDDGRVITATRRRHPRTGRLRSRRRSSTGANLDIGHFVAGNNTSPVPFLKQHHARITHVHVKDRKMHEGATTPFGQGDTPIAEVLRLIRDNKWPIQATIEFEYPVPAGSDRMAEIAKTIEFCRQALCLEQEIRRLGGISSKKQNS